jgi:prevent-host-death family protein
MEVGIRELKARLSEYVERAAEGEIVIVTSRGRRIAQIVPIPGRDNIERGLREGWITRRDHRPPGHFEPIPVRPDAPTSIEILQEDREDRTL